MTLNANEHALGTTDTFKLSDEEMQLGAGGPNIPPDLRTRVALTFFTSFATWEPRLSTEIIDLPIEEEVILVSAAGDIDPTAPATTIYPEIENNSP